MKSFVIHARSFDSAIVEILEVREKSYKVKNVDCGRVCFLPKSGLKPYKPGVPSYEGEFVLAAWFHNKMSDQQARVLNILA